MDLLARIARPELKMLGRYNCIVPFFYFSEIIPWVNSLPGNLYFSKYFFIFSMHFLIRMIETSYPHPLPPTQNVGRRGDILSCSLLNPPSSYALCRRSLASLNQQLKITLLFNVAQITYPHPQLLAAASAC
jgi:hypothetical protein